MALRRIAPGESSIGSDIDDVTAPDPDGLPADPIAFGNIKFYHPEYCPFGGYTDRSNIVEGIDAYAELTDNFFVVGERPNFSAKIRLKKDLVCYQMLLDNPVDVVAKEEITELRSEKEKSELFILVNLVQPGYFKSKTAALGRYYGIYADDLLVAVTGERMKMNKYTEVSAVVTHPQHTGKSYAKQLIAHTTNKIFSEGKLPYLHVSDANVSTIALYKKLGFKTRRNISFWHLITDG